MKCCENKAKNKILYMALAVTIIFGIYYGRKTSIEIKEVNQQVEGEVDLIKQVKIK